MRKKTNRKHNPLWWILAIIAVFIIVGIFTRDNTPGQRPLIGLVEINETILSSRETVKHLNYFNNRSDIDAILIRLDTPGGAVAASQEIFEKVKKIAAGDKPIVASMGNLAASGGYYVAIGANRILANPGTATGSIGVIMGYPVAEELMQRFGVDYKTVKSGSLKDAGSFHRAQTEADRIYFQNLINNLHDQFVQAVAGQRNLPVSRVAELASGAAYSGVQALEYGLIDSLGTFEDAVYLAGKLAGYDNRPTLVKPPEDPKTFIELVKDQLESVLSVNWKQTGPKYQLVY